MVACSGGDGLDHNYVDGDAGVENCSTLITELLNHGAMINTRTDRDGIVTYILCMYSV